LYEEWLPQSGTELRDFLLFLQRRNFFPEVNEAALETDIYLPIQ
jgi:AraC family transcriptional regulator